MRVEIGKPERMPLTHCLRCGHELDGRTQAGEISPEGGDVSVCAYCGDVAFFTDDLSLREPTPEEKAELNSDRAFCVMVAAIRRNPKK